jgi:phosphatidylinositol glycan class W
MDLGVGCTLLISALSRRVAAAHTARRAEHHAGAGRRSAIALGALGVARTAVLSRLGYHVDESEYGTHWNFFITLGAVAAITRAAAPRDARRAAAGGATLLLAHQAALCAGMAHWVHTAPRVGWISANKEGLCALPGHVALALIGDGIGAVLLPARSASTWRASLRRLAVLSAALFIAHYAACDLIEPTSRRTCNLAYALWACAQLLLIACVCVGGALIAPLAPPPLIERHSDRPLSTFLLANLLTGAANAALRADDASAPLALAALTVYAALVCAGAAALPARTSAHLVRSASRDKPRYR